MLLLPNQLSPLVDRLGRIVRPWVQYLQQFTQAPPNFMTITVSASPFEYLAAEPGNVALTGGTITGLVLTRGSNSINLGAGTDKLIPVSIQDILTVSYSVLPTINFIPSYGQNTTSN